MRKYLSHTYLLIAVSAIAFGIIGIVAGDFHKNFMPVPETTPGRKILLYLVCLAFLLPGILIFIHKTKYKAALALGSVFLLLYLILHLDKLLTNIHDAGEWAASTEVIGLCCGALFAARLLQNRYNDPNTTKPGFSKVYISKVYIIARYIFALVLLVFGIQHFMYADYIATLIPAWIPAKLFFAYFVGVVFLSTALSLIINWQTQLSTFLLGVMFLLWVIILHAPRVAVSSNTEAEWTSLFVALAMCGTAFSLSFISTKATYSTTI